MHNAWPAKLLAIRHLNHLPNCQTRTLVTEPSLNAVSVCCRGTSPLIQGTVCYGRGYGYTDTNVFFVRCGRCDNQQFPADD